MEYLRCDNTENFSFFFLFVSFIATVCESKKLQISCPGKRLIRINQAMYGRTKRGLCGDDFRPDCRAGNSLSIVKRFCEGKNKCSVLAENSVFGDPCPNIQKYLTVDYYCDSDSKSS